MQVFINISSKVAFILKSYVRQPSRVSQNFHGVPFPPRSHLLPETGSNKLQFLHSVEVRYFTDERSTLCCTTGQLIPVHNSMMWGPEDDLSQSRPLRDLACLLGVHQAHIVNYGNGLYRPLDARTIV